MSGSDTSVGYVVFGETPGVPIQTCIVQPLHLMMYRPCFSSADTPNVVALICCQLLVSAFLLWHVEGGEQFDGYV